MNSQMIDMIASPFALLGLAIALDMVMGEPHFLWSRLPHPVVLFGKAISALEKRLNLKAISGKKRRAYGIIAIILWVLLALGVGYGITLGLDLLPPLLGFVSEMVLVAILLAGRSLYDHITAVMRPLYQGDIEGARFAVSMIVGRDTSSLSESDIARAAIETGAENLSDGVIAPALWYLIGGLPLMLAYKMINTSDSMVGYKSSRYYAFGWGSAMTDDVANFLPARLTAYLIIMIASFQGTAQKAHAIVRKDADSHASPNAGYPEAAMAGALDIRLGGSRCYRGAVLDLPAMNESGNQDVSAQDIERALQMLWRCLGAASIILLLIAFYS